MPQADVRASGLDVLARTGSPLTITLTWPTGYLTGKSFSASVGGTAITPAIAGDVMTLSLTAAQTTTLGNGRHTLLLTDTTGDDVVRIAGRVLLGTSSTDSPDASVTVLTDTSVSVTVAVAVGIGLPLPSGTATVGYVPAVTDDDPLTLAWTDVGTQIELDAEAAARAAADTTLQTNITAEAAARAAADALLAPLASPTFTGTPAAPTAAANTNTTQLATTAYVQTEITDEVTRADGAYLTPAQANGTYAELATAPGSEMGYAERTSSTTTTSTTLFSTTNKISGLSVTVTGEGRAVDVEFFASQMRASVANNYVAFWLLINGAVTGGQLGVMSAPDTTNNRSTFMKRRMVLTDGVSYTFEIGWSTQAGTATLDAAAGYPASLSVTRR